MAFSARQHSVSAEGKSVKGWTTVLQRTKITAQLSEININKKTISGQTGNGF